MGVNWSYYSNAEIDALINEVLTTFDAGKQQDLLKQIDKAIYDDAMGVTVFAFPQITAYSEKLEGISSSALAPTFFWNYWLWKAPVKE